MNTVGIVLVSILAGLFLAFLSGVSIYLAWDQYRLRRLLSDSSTLLTTISVTLDTRTSALDAKLSRLNGDELALASRRIVGAANRIEIAGGAFGEMARHLLSENAFELRRGAASGLGDGDYAPASPGERYTSQSRVARGDADALEEVEGTGMAAGGTGSGGLDGGEEF